MKKRILSLFLIAVLMLTMVPMVFAKDSGFNPGIDFGSFFRQLMAVVEELGLGDGAREAAKQLGAAAQDLKEELKTAEGLKTPEETTTEPEVTTEPATTRPEQPAAPPVREPDIGPPYYFYSIDGGEKHRMATGIWLPDGTHTLAVYHEDGWLCDQYRVEANRGQYDAVDNGDGTWTLTITGKPKEVVVDCIFDRPEPVIMKDGSVGEIPPGWKVNFLIHSTDREPTPGISLRWKGAEVLPNGGFGGLNAYMVVEVYYNGEQVFDYVPKSNTCTVTRQSDGTLLLQKNSAKQAEFTVTYNGESAGFEAFFG